MSTRLAEQYEQTADYLINRGINKVDAAIVLGTGLSASSLLDETLTEIPYNEIPGFPMSTVEGHEGLLSYGIRAGKWVVVLRGRFHYYEGYSMDDVTYYVHVLAALNTSVLFITNAAGGLNPHYRTGDLVLVTDHINLFPQHPLRGQWGAELGPRFPDMMHAYPVKWQNRCKDAASKLGISLKQGVYLGWQGPSLETPAEYKMARLLGADLVGMSTVPEVIVAKFRSLEVAVISVVSNVCFPASVLQETTIEAVIKVMHNSSEKLSRLLSQLLESEC